MACRGVYFSLTKQDAKRLLDAGDDETTMAIIQEDIEQRWDEEWLLEVDKSWDAIHRCLTDGTLRCKNKSVLERFVLGGRQLHQGPNYIVSYLDSQELVELVEHTKAITKEWFRERFFGLRKRFLGIVFSDYDGPNDEPDFEYSWTGFENIRLFFQRSAHASRAVIFTVDQ